MIHILATYHVKAGAEELVERVVREFVRAVAAREPTTEYRAFRLAGRQDFVHFMSFADEPSHQAHRQASYTLKLVEQLYPFCDKEPTFTPLIEIS